MKFTKCTLALIATVLFSLASNCIGQETGSKVFPASDPSNTGGWTLNNDVSDEFESPKLDTAKWLVQGTDGVYRSDWIGRAPSQFSTGNVRVEDGKLKLETRWEPGFEFSDKLDDGKKYENITTAAVISKKQFHYGYMEIKCKAADASITSSFWMTGNNSELDIFEFLGNPAQKHKTELPTELWSSIHDWSKPGGPSTWTDRLQLDFRVADDFHVYGAEWNENYLNFYADGKLVRIVTKEEVGAEGWVINKPLWVWVDSETFPWHGIPVAADLPVNYEIEYIRVWTGNSSRENPESVPAVKRENLLDVDLYGLEAPMSVNGKKMDWWIAEDSREYFSVVENKAASGKKSLKFTHSGPMARDAVAFAPNGSMKIDAGKYEFSMKVWIEPGSSVNNVKVIFQDPWLELKAFDLTSAARGKWVTLKQAFNRTAASTDQDRPRFLVQKGDVTGPSSTIYFDELSIEKK